MKDTVEQLRHQDLSLPDRAGQQQPQPHTSVPVALAERKEKSLGLLAQSFIQMLLCVTDMPVVALEDAAKTLLGKC